MANIEIKKILCPIDFSTFYRLANELASEFAAELGASVVYLNVAKKAAGKYGYEMDRVTEVQMQKLQDIRPSHSKTTFSHRVRVSTLVGQEIVEFAAENDIDLIVRSTHGRTGMRRVLMGSVAEFIVRNAKCAVLTVKPEREQLKESEIEKSEEVEA